VRLVVAVLGWTLLEITTDPEVTPRPNGLEATGGGQFEIGFGGSVKDHEVTVRRR
jgi:hypothetical protein